MDVAKQWMDVRPGARVGAGQAIGCPTDTDARNIQARSAFTDSNSMSGRGRGRPVPGRPGGKARADGDGYQAQAVEETNPYDDTNTTKAYAREQQKAKVVRYGDFYGPRINISDDELDDDELDEREGPALSAAPAVRARRKGLSWLSDLSIRSGAGGGTYYGSPATVTLDLRNATSPQVEMPRGVELVGGGEPLLEVQEVELQHTRIHLARAHCATGAVDRTPPSDLLPVRAARACRRAASRCRCRRRSTSSARCR